MSIDIPENDNAPRLLKLVCHNFNYLLVDRMLFVHSVYIPVALIAKSAVVILNVLPVYVANIAPC